MLNYIWSFMILFSFIVAFLTGRIEQTTKALFDSAGSAVQMSIGLLGIMCLWTGLMNICEKSGLIKIIAKGIKPITRILFPKVPSTSPAMGAIVLNIVANMMGLANSATPLGLKAMKELNELNGRSSRASDAMCMFVIINTASIQIIPATVIAIRVSAGSSNPFEIILPVWIAGACALIVGITSAKILN